MKPMPRLSILSPLSFASLLYALCTTAAAQTPGATNTPLPASTTPLAPAAVIAPLASPAVLAPAATTNSAPPASASICFSCHGPDGNPIAKDYPILKGQQRDYLVAALGAYRASQRTTTPNALVMSAMAKSLSDAEIAELADWFAMVRR